MKCKVHHFKTFLSKLYFNMSYMLVVNTCCVAVIQSIFAVYLMIYIYIYIYIYMKSSFSKRYKSILIVFMKMTFFYLDPYILLIFN